ncbi:MAG: hypothetical protein JXA89_03630 [Anaerolineae bacterium]|nr:hypothetical protein [Anaerolineae bacterium]
MDAYLEEILFAVPFLVTLLLAGGLWWMAWRASEFRGFWGWLAAGLTANVAGNVVWIVHDMATGTVLPPLSWVDLLFVARYVCFGIAFLLYPAPWPRQKLLEVGGVIVLTALGVWVCIYRTEFVFVKRDWDQVLGVAMYPVFDLGLIYMLSARWREMSTEPWRRSLFLLFLSALSYGGANGIQFCVRMASVDDSSNWATLFWFLSDVLMIAAIVWFARRREDRPEIKEDPDEISEPQRL